MISTSIGVKSKLPAFVYEDPQILRSDYRTQLLRYISLHQKTQRRVNHQFFGAANCSKHADTLSMKPVLMSIRDAQQRRNVDKASKNKKSEYGKEMISC